MAEIPGMDAGALARRRRLQGEVTGQREGAPLGPSDEPSMGDLAVCTMWLVGVALIVASLFL